MPLPVAVGQLERRGEEREGEERRGEERRGEERRGEERRGEERRGEERRGGEERRVKEEQRGGGGGGGEENGRQAVEGEVGRTQTCGGRRRRGKVHLTKHAKGQEISEIHSISNYTTAERKAGGKGKRNGSKMAEGRWLEEKCTSWVKEEGICYHT